MGGFLRTVLSFVSVLAIAANVSAATKTQQTAAEIDLSNCGALLSGEKLTRYDLIAQEWSLLDLLNADPAKNLAVQFPTMLMNSDQRNYLVATYYGQRRIVEPAYRAKKVPYYPLISEGVPETRGRAIIGHYESIAGAVDYLKARATGQRTSKMVGFIGPAGTGKTEILMLLNYASAHLAMVDPKFYQLTFVFVGLDNIPDLKPLVRAGGNIEGSSILKDLTLNRSPLVLLPPSVQKRVVELGAASFTQNFGLQPLPFPYPTRKTQRVIDSIVAHYKKLEGKTTISDSDYIRYLAGHVKIVRRRYETEQPAAIVRFKDKNTDLAPLFAVENLALSQFYGPTDPLSFQYGSVPHLDGLGVALDEFFRQSSQFRDLFLDTAQNGVIGYGAAPEEYLDATVMFATNDASIEEAQKTGAAAAHLDRTRRLPMRHALEPWHAVKIALADIGTSKFVMQDLQAETTGLLSIGSLPKLELQKVLPDTDDGRPVGPDGRYALYYYPDTQKAPILISPRSLMMLGLTASGTRMVIDRKVVDAINATGHPLSTSQQYPQNFTDPSERMRILLGEVQPSGTAASELYRFRNVAREGEKGLGAREIQDWLAASFDEAERMGGVLTPIVLSKVFAQKMDSGFAVTPKEKALYNHIAMLVKTDFLLPAISADVVGILQGQGRPEAMYDDLKRELIALKTNKDADSVTGEGNIRVPINKTRLNEIYKIYRELNGSDFDPGLLFDFHVQISEQSSVKRHPQLIEAVRRYIMRSELDKTTISDLIDYFEGRPVADEVRVRGAQAETQFEKYGYNKISFMQALLFVRDMEFEVRRQTGK